MRKLRVRISAILGPKIQGKRIDRALRTQGYTLQYSWRKFTAVQPDGTKKQIRPKRRIYRVVRLEEGQDAKEFTEIEEVADIQQGEELGLQSQIN